MGGYKICDAKFRDTEITKGKIENLQIVHINLGKKVVGLILISILLVVLRVKLDCMIFTAKAKFGYACRHAVIARYLRSSSQSIRIKLINMACKKTALTVVFTP